MSLANPVWHEVALEQSPRLMLAGLGCHGEAAQRSARYLLDHDWSLHFYRYHGWLETQGRRHRIKPFTVSLIPPGVVFRHEWEREDSRHIYHLMRLEGAGGATRIRELTGPLADGPARYAALAEAVGWVEAEPARACARVWDFLWTLTERVPPAISADVGLHPAVAEALRALATAAPGDLRLPLLAKRCGVSPNHLIRLFRAATGETPMTYGQRRRLERAANLLRDTRWSVKAVAYEAGFTDQAHFCRRFRVHFGLTPQAYRKPGAGEAGSVSSRQP